MNGSETRISPWGQAHRTQPLGIVLTLRQLSARIFKLIVLFTWHKQKHSKFQSMLDIQARATISRVLGLYPMRISTHSTLNDSFFFFLSFESVLHSFHSLKHNSQRISQYNRRWVLVTHLSNELILNKDCRDEVSEVKTSIVMVIVRFARRIDQDSLEPSRHLSHVRSKALNTVYVHNNRHVPVNVELWNLWYVSDIRPRNSCFWWLCDYRALTL